MIIHTKTVKLTAVIGLLLLSSCSDVTKEIEKTDAADKKIEIENKALALMQTNCFSCHNPDMESEVRVAPPMFKIRQHYFDDQTSKEDFIREIVAFASNPTQENSIMPGAVRNFGLMPKSSFKENDLKLIAAYIYENDLASDEWYAKWEEFKKSAPIVAQEINYEDLGRDIANKTKAELGKNLMVAVQKDGPASAVEFCSTRAIVLTDSMATVLNARVKRVSDKPRNPNNAANKEETAFIMALKSALSKGEKLSPEIAEVNGKMVGYYPIETNDLCLKCHGIPNKTIAPETLKVIKNRYPADKAVGYKAGEIRGIFVVEMEKR